MRRSILVLAITFIAAGTAVADIAIETVGVGNLSNAADSTGYGAVAYDYRIGMYEVTNAQYTAFLIDVAATDVYSLYYANMGSGYGGISRSGESGYYTYSVIAGRGNMPVNYVSFWDAARFANWLHNGQGSGDTETGAYTLTADGIVNNTITRNLDARWAVTSEDEWYKAAYFNPATSSYYDYPTSSDTTPTAEAPGGGSNSANYDTVVGDLTDVGAYTLSDSPYSTFDQGGNAWEWNDAIVYGSYRGLRGGSFSNYNSSSDMLASHRDLTNPMGESGSGGFRVSEIPDPVPAPGAVILATLGLTLAGWKLRRRKES